MLLQPSQSQQTVPIHNVSLILQFQENKTMLRIGGWVASFTTFWDCEDFDLSDLSI